MSAAYNYVNVVALILFAAIFMGPLPASVSAQGSNVITINGNIFCNSSCVLLPAGSSPLGFPTALEGVTVRVACSYTNYYKDVLVKSNTFGYFQAEWTDVSGFRREYCAVFVDHIPGNCNNPVKSDAPSVGYPLTPITPELFAAEILWFYPTEETKCPF